MVIYKTDTKTMITE